MARRRRRRSQDPDTRTVKARRRARRWSLGLAVIVLAAALVWMAPAIVAHTSLKQQIVSAALADFEGRVTVGEASLGWLSPLAAYDIAALDAAGKPLAEVKAVRSKKSLLALLSAPSRPGSFRVEKPALYVALRPDGSNWEDALAAYFEDASGGDAIEQLELEIVDAAIEVRDDATGQRWRADGVNAAVNIAGAAPQVIRARMVGRVQAREAEPGSVAADLVWKRGRPGDSSGWGEGQLGARVESLPVEVLASAARRFGTEVHARGVLTGDAVCQWSAGGSALRIQFDRLAARDLAVRAPAWLGEDELQTAYLNGRARIAKDGARWQFTGLAVDTDFGRLEADGTVRLDQLAKAGAGLALLGKLPEEALHIAGQLDVPRLAAMLASTLKVRPTTRVQSGRVTFRVDTEPGETPAIAARAELADFAAAAGEHRIAWKNPILVTARFRNAAEGPVIEELVCRSSFLNVSAQGTLTQGAATVEGDLTRLASEAARLVDLGGLVLAGRLDGTLRWQRDGQRQVAADGQIALSDFRLATPGAQPWEEKRLVMDLAMAADVNEGRIARVETASATLRSGSDELRADLIRPVDEPSGRSPWPMRLRLRGQLATWLPRLQPFFSTGTWQIDGAVDVDATAEVSGAKIDADRVRVQLDDLRARGDGWRIDEPAVRLETQACWNMADRQLVADQIVMTSSTVAFRAKQVVLAFPEGTAPRAAGSLSYRADLGRLARWFDDARRPADWRLGGSVVGVVEAKHESETTQVRWSADVKDLTWAARKTEAGAPTAPGAIPVAHEPEWRELWREAAVKLSGRNRYDHPRDTLSVDALTATTDAAQVRASGTIASLRGARVADLRGDVVYDLAVVTQKLQRLWGPNIQLVGKDKGTFEIRGPLRVAKAASSDSRDAAAAMPAGGAPSRGLVPPELTARARLGWQGANIQGLRAGPGKLDASLAKGVVSFKPLDVPVSEGRLRAAPRIDLNGTPVILQVAAGPFLENMRISPEMCRTWLKYVAPLVADATSAEGRFSIALDGARVPLAAPEQSRVRGRLTIHAARVGPGPLARQFLSAAQQVKGIVEQGAGGVNLLAASWLELPQQTVAFAVDDGRVQHQGMTVAVGDVTIRTSGSVGFDQSIALAANIPIRDRWVDGKRYLLALKGTSVKIPVHGTFSQPRLDSRALRDLSRSLLRDAAGRLLEDELNRGLRRLFGPQG